MPAVSLLGGLVDPSIGRPMEPEGINEDGLLVGKIVEMLLNDLGSNAQDMVALPVADEVKEIHGLDHIISPDACLVRNFPD